MQVDKKYNALFSLAYLSYIQDNDYKIVKNVQIIII